MRKRKIGELPVDPSVGDLFVWHNPQVGAVGNFHYPVKSVADAAVLLDLLADYDLFQYENNVKGDYANASGLIVCAGVEDGVVSWEEWSSEEGEDISEIMRSTDFDQELTKANKAEVERLCAVQDGKTAGLNYQWIPMYNKRLGNKTTPLNCGRFPYYLFLEGTFARDRMDAALGRDLILSMDSPEFVLTWPFIADCLGAKAFTNIRGVHDTAQEAYASIIQHLMDSPVNVREVYLGHFMYYGNREETAHVYDAKYHASKHLESDVDIYPRHVIEKAANDWALSMLANDPFQHARLLNAHYISNQRHLTNYYALLTGKGIENESVGTRC